MWFKTTTTDGGKLIGFGDARSGNSSNYDRHVYMENDGQLIFGVWTGQARHDHVVEHATTTGSGTIVATQEHRDGMKLYVDGRWSAPTPQHPGAELHRLLGGSVATTERVAAPADEFYFAGTHRTRSRSTRPLSRQAQVTAHYQAGSATTPANQKPTASFTRVELGSDGVGGRVRVVGS